ncbi:histidine kinase [Aliiglaciecola sp.]|nr:histidine kinase [Aliiglaciecola sp.]
MEKLKKVLSVESSTAVLAWLVVSSSAIWLMVSSGSYSTIAIALAAACLLTFIVGFLLSISEFEFRNDYRVRIGLMLLQYTAVVAAVFFIPYSYIAILVTIWSAQLPYFMPFRYALLASPLWTAPIWLVFAFYWDANGVGLSALLFWTFNLFALVMVNATIKEKRATEAANELNRELVATQTLLSEASKQAERVRIARNIHDLLGHHLTALTINLQVASRITEGEAQQKVQQCHDLSKLLLSDVREAVSEIREKSTIKLEDALTALLRDVPNLDIALNMRPDIIIDDVNMAETILRCVQEGITNTLKHSNAKHFSIELEQQGNWVTLQMRDNGTNKKTMELKEGNGLLGMRERITALGGKVSSVISIEGFSTQIQLPYGEI